MNPINKVIKLCGNQSSLADLLDVTQSAVSQWSRGVRPVPAARCKAIEKITKNQVTCSDLRPDVFGFEKDSAA